MRLIERSRVDFKVRLSPRAAAACLCLAASLAASLSAGLSGCAAVGQCGLRACTADTTITAQVRALLAQSPALDAPNSISVQTDHGVVYLRGLVSTPYQIAEAGSIAARVSGVSRVQNLLSIDNSR
jgi:osmotically-inducible protein OsmY